MFYLDSDEPALIKDALKSPFFYGISLFLCVWLFSITGISPQFFTLCVFSVILVLLSIVDAKTFILPDRLMYPLWISGFVFPVLFLEHPFLVTFLGAVLGFLFFFLISYGYEKIKGYPGMGFGDVKLLSVLGAWCGLTSLPLILLISSLLSIFCLLFRQLILKVGLENPIPFGPSLCAAGWVSLLYQDAIWNAIFNAREQLSFYVEALLL